MKALRPKEPITAFASLLPQGDHCDPELIFRTEIRPTLMEERKESKEFLEREEVYFLIIASVCLAVTNVFITLVWKDIRAIISGSLEKAIKLSMLGVS